ncbi:NUDIX hydrolase [Synechococcus sp. FGCU-3]|nr:NUDIX hydrolase [Synechococcus sp. FGCU3]
MSAPVEVALAMLERDGRWLMQLRDSIPGIVAPGCWGLFGGHLDSGETPEQAVRRELIEEIGWPAGELNFWRSHTNERRVAHLFLGPLTVPLEQLQLLEGEAMALVRSAELLSGRIWSEAVQEFRPLAPGLAEALGPLLKHG